IRVAAFAGLRPSGGVFVVLNNQIHAPREVSKTATDRLEAFRSPEVGPIGFTDLDGRVTLYRKTARITAPATIFDARLLESLPRVDISYSYPGADHSAIAAFVTAGARAIVVAAMGEGIPTPLEERGLVDARKQGVVVVLSSRTGGGRVLARPRFARQGFVSAD